MRRDRDIECSSNRSAVRTSTLPVAKDLSNPQQIFESVRLFVWRSRPSPDSDRFFFVQFGPPIPSSKLFVEHGRSAVELLRGAGLLCGLRSVRPPVFAPAIAAAGPFRGEIQDRWPIYQAQKSEIPGQQIGCLYAEHMQVHPAEHWLNL